MRADNGGVDHDVFEVWIIGHGSEQPIPDAILGPAREPHEHAVPIAEQLRQVPPWRTRPGQPQYRFHEQPVVSPSPAGIASLAGQVGLHPFPLVILQDQANPAHSNPLPEKEFESDFRARGNPECQRALAGCGKTPK